MERKLKLIQGNYCCLYQNKLISLTEKNYVFIEIDLKTSRVSLMDKKNLENRIEYITSIGDALYLVDMGGKWIAETTVSSAEISCYPIPCNRKSTGNFSYICEYGGNLFLFLREEPAVVIFDTVTKAVSRKELRIHDFKANFDSGCVKGNSVYLFSGNAKKYYVYDLDERKVIQEKDLHIEGLASCVTCYENDIFILSRNAVYSMNNNFEMIVKINDPVYCSKICIAGGVIWFLPGLGEKIYTYRFGETDAREYGDYPEDYEYDIENGWGKFVGKAEDTDNIYWSMRSNNYILSIRKKDGKECWMQPYISDEALLMEKSFFSVKGRILHEGTLKLNDLINHLT